MRWTRWLCAASLLLLVVQGTVFAAEGSKPFQLNNRLRVEYDDNIYQSGTLPDGSDTLEAKKGGFKVIEEVDFLVNLNLENTYISLRYRPQFVWWENREPDKTDFNNDLDFVLNHDFSPRLSLSLMDTLRRGELPELQEGNILVREEDDFYYNSANGTLSYLFRPTTKLEVAGRYILLKYDDAVTADNENYNTYVGGLTLRHSLQAKTTILGDLRYEFTDYDGLDRGSKNIYAGAGVEQTFNPSLIGNLRGGWQQKKFNMDDLGTENSPYGDLSLTILPSPATRITLGASYMLYQANVYPYADQKQLQAYCSLAYDITAKIAWYLSGGYTLSDYSQDYAAADKLISPDGKENIYQASTRLTYKINRNNWLEAGYQFVDFDSDLRVSYKRNRVDVGWKIQL
ncbi:MAG: outer membrane beta-barrel protein [Lentisphaerota bacterium]